MKDSEWYKEMTLKLNTNVLTGIAIHVETLYQLERHLPEHVPTSRFKVIAIYSAGLVRKILLNSPLLTPLEKLILLC